MLLQRLSKKTVRNLFKTLQCTWKKQASLRISLSIFTQDKRITFMKGKWDSWGKKFLKMRMRFIRWAGVIFHFQLTRETYSRNRKGTSSFQSRKCITSNILSLPFWLRQKSSEWGYRRSLQIETSKIWRTSHSIWTNRDKRKWQRIHETSQLRTPAKINLKNTSKSNKSSVSRRSFRVRK